MYQGQNTSPVLPWYVGGTGAHWMSPNQYTGLVTSTGRGGADIEQMYRSQQVGRGAPGSAAEMTRATTMGFSNWQQQQQGGGGFNPGGAPQGPFNAGGGGGGAPQGPYGSFGSGTPSSVEQARQMAFQGTLDPWRNFYANAPGFQNVLQREQDIGMGQNLLNYDPLRAEAADQAAGAARSSMSSLQAGMSSRGLRASPGAMNAAQAPIRRDLGSAYRRIGFQESQDNMARQTAARGAVSNMWGQQQQNIAGSSMARLGELGKMQEVTGGGGGGGGFTALGGGSPQSRGLLDNPHMAGLQPYQSQFAQGREPSPAYFDRLFNYQKKMKDLNQGGGGPVDTSEAW